MRIFPNSVSSRKQSNFMHPIFRSIRNRDICYSLNCLCLKKVSCLALNLTARWLHGFKMKGSATVVSIGIFSLNAHFLRRTCHLGSVFSDCVFFERIVAVGFPSSPPGSSCTSLTGINEIPSPWWMLLKRKHIDFVYFSLFHCSPGPANWLWFCWVERNDNKYI